MDEAGCSVDVSMPGPDNFPVSVPEEAVPDSTQDEGSKPQDEATKANEPPTGSLSVFPVSRMKKLIRKNEEVKLLRADAVHVLSLAVEHFIKQITESTYQLTQARKRKIMTSADLAELLRSIDAMEFLDGNLPELDTVKVTSKRAAKQSEGKQKRSKKATTTETTSTGQRVLAQGPFQLAASKPACEDQGESEMQLPSKPAGEIEPGTKAPGGEAEGTEELPEGEQQEDTELQGETEAPDSEIPEDSTEISSAQATAGDTLQEDPAVTSSKPDEQ